MISECQDLFSVACHDAIWEQIGSSVELSLSLWELLQIVFASSFILFFGRIFSEPLKKHILLGYLPTLIVVVRDRRNGNYLMFGRSYLNGDDKVPSRVWNFPQAVMERADIKDQARDILKLRLGLDINQYDFTDRELDLGRRKIKKFKREINTKLGFSLFRRARGRAYLAVEVDTEFDVREDGVYILDRKLESILLEDLEIVDKDGAVELVRSSHEGYKRREGKIPILMDVIDGFGDNQKRWKHFAK
jgi:hypothetical protein